MEKENLPKWEDITRCELGKLYFGQTKQNIADLFGITKKDVDKKLKEFGINKYNSMWYNDDFNNYINDIITEYKESKNVRDSKNI